MADPDTGIATLREERAKRRQRALDALRKTADTSPSARRLLRQIDPDGTLTYWPADGGTDG